jgi:hypothetical protein
MRGILLSRREEEWENQIGKKDVPTFPRGSTRQFAFDCLQQTAGHCRMFGIGVVDNTAGKGQWAENSAGLGWRNA